MNINCDCAYAHMKKYATCALQFAWSGLRHTLLQAAAQAPSQVAAQAAATGRSTGRSTHIAARRPHGFLCVRTRNRIYVHTHAARKWNCWEFHCAISGNTEKVEICSTRCGLRPAACGLRPTAKYEPALIIEIPVHWKYFSAKYFSESITGVCLCKEILSMYFYTSLGVSLFSTMRPLWSSGKMVAFHSSLIEDRRRPLLSFDHTF